jgi:hypothetical protein
MATKKNTIVAKTDETIDIEQPEKTPAQLQREHDGADHGVRMHSADEVHARHGIDVVRENERKAREHRRRS